MKEFLYYAGIAVAIFLVIFIGTWLAGIGALDYIFTLISIGACGGVMWLGHRYAHDPGTLVEYERYAVGAASIGFGTWVLFDRPLAGNETFWSFYRIIDLFDDDGSIALLFLGVVFGGVYGIWYFVRDHLEAKALGQSWTVGLLGAMICFGVLDLIYLRHKPPGEWFVSAIWIFGTSLGAGAGAWIVYFGFLKGTGVAANYVRDMSDDRVATLRERAIPVTTRWHVELLETILSAKPEDLEAQRALIVTLTNPVLREAALDALEKARGGDSLLIDVLQGTADPELATPLVELIGRGGEEVPLDTLIYKRVSSNNEALSQALDDAISRCAMGRLPELIELLAKQLEAHPEGVEAALLGLDGKTLQSGGDGPIAAKIQSGSPEEARLAARILGQRMKLPGLLPILAARAEGNAELIAEALAGRRKNEILPLLEENQPEVVRAGAARRLAGYEGDDVKERLWELWDDEQALVQTAARGALVERSADDFEVLQGFLDPERFEPGVRASAAAALGRMETPGSLELLWSLRDDPEPAIQASAQASLEDRADEAVEIFLEDEPEALEPLIEQLGDLTYPGDPSGVGQAWMRLRRLSRGDDLPGGRLVESMPIGEVETIWRAVEEHGGALSLKAAR